MRESGNEGVRWYRKPGGSVHAFRGVWTLCRRFIWQASWAITEPGRDPDDDLCPTCHQLARPVTTLNEDQLIAAYGGLPIDR